jgi:hypothetical protein
MKSVQTLQMVALLALGAGVTSPTSARAALLDRNGDGISDVWAALYPSAGAPSADPDGDGQNNLAEAQAGTDPTSAASRLIATAAPDASGNLLVSWPSMIGKFYFIETSGDLVRWMPIPGEYSGTGSELSAIVRPAGAVSGARTFWHVVVFDFDSDANGLNDWEETHPEALTSIAASAGANGSISPNGRITVAKGSSITLTLTPAVGYGIESVVVDGQSAGPVASYTFGNIQEEHSIAGNFKSLVSLAISPGSLSLPAQAGTAVATVSSGTSWNAASDQPWLTVSPANGSGNATVTFSAEANRGAARLATVTFQSGGATSTVSLNQLAGIDAAVTFSVAPSGNDSNPGSIDQPFATLEKARDAARLINGNMTHDIIVSLQPGTYRLSRTFALDARDSGSNGYDIVYQGSPSGTPTISGGQQITGWTLHDAAKSIYRASVPAGTDTRQLYVNGVRAVRARSADAAGWSASGDGYTCPSAVASWRNIQNVEVVAFWEWTCGRGPLASVSGTHATMAQPYWSYRRVGEQPVWIENAYELLDSEGEWYLEKSTSTLFYKPRSGESMSSAEVVVPVLETLVKGDNLAHVQFRGLTFAHATWTEPNSSFGIAIGQADALRNGSSGGSFYLRANLEFTGCDHMRFEKNCFTRLGGTGLKLGSGCDNNVVYGNLFSDISGSGLFVGHLGSLDSGLFGKNNVISQNLIVDVAKEYKASVGIMVGYTEATLVSQNELRNLPYTAISAGWGWSNTIVSGKNNEIAYNRIDSVMQELKDGGGIYTLSDQPGANVHHNYISNCNGNGLYPDEGSSHMHWHDNVVQNAIKWAHLWVGTISYDTVDFNFANTANALFNATNTVVENNTIVLDGNWPQSALEIMAKAGRNVSALAQLDNLARAKPSLVSTNWPGYSGAGGNDGDLGTIWASDGAEANPWFQVNLGQATPLGGILLEARQNMDQLNVRTDFEVQGSNTSSFSTYTVLGGNDSTKGDLPFPGYGEWKVQFSGSAAYQYLRVKRLNGAGHFNFSELVAFPTREPLLTNLALFKPAAVSSSWSGYSAAWGTDGNLDTIWASDSVERSPRFQLDLGRAISFDTVVLVARQNMDQPSSRTNFEIQGSNSEAFSTYTVLGGNYASRGDTPFSAYGKWTLKLASPAAFRYIRVQRVQEAGHFNFAEVIVLSSSESGGGQ